MGQHEDKWPFLDLVRFGAAFLVLLGHVRGLFFDSIRNVPDAGVLTKAFYVASGVHHEAVVLFFAVSGFLIGGRVWELAAARAFRPGAYLLDRFTRIYVVLVPALLLIGAIEAIGHTFLADTRLYGERPLMPTLLQAGWTPAQIPCHLAALPGIACEPWGANPPLWSLGYEWAFYLLAPLLLCAWYADARLPLRVAAVAIVFLSVAALLPANAHWPFWFAAWFLGAVSRRVLRASGLPLPLGLGGLALVAFGMIAARADLAPLLATDALVALGIALALACPAIVRFSLFERAVAAGASFSFSLYILHLPVAVLFGAFLERLGWPSRLVQPDLAAYGVLASTLAVALAVAYAFARATEANTAALRRWLRGDRRNVASPGDVAQGSKA